MHISESVLVIDFPRFQLFLNSLISIFRHATLISFRSIPTTSAARLKLDEAEHPKLLASSAQLQILPADVTSWSYHVQRREEVNV